MEQHTLTKTQEKLLREQVIDDDHPGPILRDFHTLLAFVGPEGVPAAGKYHLLPLDGINALDRLLSRPLHLQLKRAMPSSHPTIQGLLLLLRTTGLSRPEGSGSKPRLALDPAMLAQWNALNPTERYFALLEAWLLVSRPDTVGESSRWSTASLPDCLRMWSSLPPEGKVFDTEESRQGYIWGIQRTFYHLALADLFGLMNVDLPDAPTSSWHLTGLTPLPFGDALFSVLSRAESLAWGGSISPEEDEGGEAGFGSLRPLLQPYFPAWRNTLVLPEEAPREGVFVFKVSLGGVWRKIAIPSGATLADLANAILNSVNFDDDHLYAFTYRNRFGAEVGANHPFMDEGPWADDVAIDTLPLKPGEKMSFLFDFGDKWRFDVKLERIDPPAPRMKKPRILERHGKAPKQYPDWE